MKSSVPTLGELNRNPRWLWVHCRNANCHHKEPMAITPFVIRWGANASSNILRERARCVQCGGLGADLYHPSWQDSVIGSSPFPVSKD